jgi:hypothetical protein
MMHLLLSSVVFLSYPYGSWKLSDVIAHTAYANIYFVGVQNGHRNISVKILDTEFFPWKLMGEESFYRNI